MEWLELCIKTTSAGVDTTGARLTALGYDSFLVDDEEDFRLFLEQNHQYWDYVDEELDQSMRGLSQIRLYLENDDRAQDRIAALRQELSKLKASAPLVGDLSLSVRVQRDEDWENGYKQYYQPIPIGKRLIVVPQWLSPENEEGRLPVILDPGLTFGTGAHASTRMCMEALEELIQGGEQVVDLGCGSGILSIAALRLGAGHALGVDIDEKAEDVARENAAFNGIGAECFTAMTGNVLQDLRPIAAACPEGFDLVIANIVADVIIPLAPLARQLGRPGSSFLCSGILEARLPEVEAAIQGAGMHILSRRISEDGWCCLTARI